MLLTETEIKEALGIDECSVLHGVTKQDVRAIEAKIMPRIRKLEAELVALQGEQKMRRMAEESNAKLLAENEALRKDAERWRDLVSHQKFNNKPQVGYAINRTIERIDAARGVK